MGIWLAWAPTGNMEAGWRVEGRRTDMETGRNMGSRVGTSGLGHRKKMGLGVEKWDFEKKAVLLGNRVHGSHAVFGAFMGIGKRQAHGESAHQHGR